MPNVPMVAVFDTAFHQTMPEKAFYMDFHMNITKKIKLEDMDFMVQVMTLYLRGHVNF